MKRPYKPLCGASLPDQDIERGQHYCCRPAGHTGWHEDEDDERMWSDADVVQVVRIEKIRAVPHHEHVFGPGAIYRSPCSGHEGCKLVLGEYQAQQEWWRKEQADICSHCGHAQHCHTLETPDEGGRNYCTECKRADEFHIFDEKPPESPQERLRAQLLVLLGPQLPQSRVEAVVDVLMRLMNQQGENR